MQEGALRGRRAGGGRDGQHPGQLPPLDPGAAAPAAAARSASTMHRCARGHSGGGRRRVNPRSVHPSFLCQLGDVHCCLGSKALPPLSRDEGRKSKREKGKLPGRGQLIAFNYLLWLVAVDIGLTFKIDLSKKKKKKL